MRIVKDYISVTIAAAHVRNEMLKNGASVQSYSPLRLKRLLDTYVWVIDQV